jgi:hypothetical protein
MSHSTKRTVGLLGHKARAAKPSVVGSFQSLHWPSRPQALNLEITSTCDAAFELFQKFVDEAAALKRRGGEFPFCATCNDWVPPPTAARPWS